ncbi:hypothetical protein ACSSS7_005316 [Eimeria intestinalis]
MSGDEVGAPRGAPGDDVQRLLVRVKEAATLKDIKEREEAFAAAAAAAAAAGDAHAGLKAVIQMARSEEMRRQTDLGVLLLQQIAEAALVPLFAAAASPAAAAAASPAAASPAAATQQTAREFLLAAKGFGALLERDRLRVQRLLGGSLISSGVRDHETAARATAAAAAAAAAGIQEQQQQQQQEQEEWCCCWCCSCCCCCC